KDIVAAHLDATAQLLVASVSTQQMHLPFRERRQRENGRPHRPILLLVSEFHAPKRAEPRQTVAGRLEFQRVQGFTRVNTHAPVQYRLLHLVRPGETYRRGGDALTGCERKHHMYRPATIRRIAEPAGGPQIHVCKTLLKESLPCHLHDVLLPALVPRPINAWREFR